MLAVLVNPGLPAATTKANMIEELDDVVLTCDLPEHGSSAGARRQPVRVCFFGC